MPQPQQIAGLTASRLEELCQGKQIERTMYLLFSLNHWAKARERLFYVDRQGLYAVKGAILRQAFKVGALLTHCYIDGIEGFGTELAFDMAADIAAEGFLWRLEEPPFAQDDLYNRIVRQLYTRITGKETIPASEIENLDVPQVREYILAQLQELEREARATRRPLPCDELRNLCIAPSDLLYIQDRRYYDLGNWDSWDQLDESDLRKLDPEGLSLIVFHHISPYTHYTFHMPLRLAEAFVPAQLIEQLKCTPRTSRENGEYYGRAITEGESLQHPIADIIRELGVDIAAICPRQLSDKQEFIHTQAMRYIAWNGGKDFADEDEDEDELDEMFWQEIHKPPSSNKAWPVKIYLEPDACPLCPELVSVNPGLARVHHWQQEHPGLDLTISQASWVLSCELSKQAFCQQYPPDYREPHERGWGTRYWKTETLAGWMKEQEKKELEM